MAEQNPSENERGASRVADAAAARWSEQHPEADIDHPAPEAAEEDEDIVPNRHSASAEAAHIRWHEEHEGHEG